MIEHLNEDMQEIYKRQLRMFIDQGVISSEVSDSLAASWQRSKEYAVDPHCTAVMGEKNKDVLTELIILLNAKDADFFNAEAEIMASVGGAIIFTDSIFSVFAIRGCRELKDKLRSINLRFGSSLAESNVGTTAISLAYNTGETSWVYGNQHYCDILSDYVCVAACPKTSLQTKSTATIHSMIIFPKEKFGSQQELLATYILNTNLYRSDSFMNTNYLVANSVINSLIGSRKMYVICTDMDNRIIDVSDSLLQNLSASLGSFVGVDICTFFPRLEGMLDGDYDNSGVVSIGACSLSETNMRGNYFGKIFTVKIDGESIGKVVFASKDPESLTEAGIIKSSSFDKDRVQNKLDLYSPRYNFSDLVGQTESFNHAVYKAHRVSKTQSNVLILGESGTGKELFAQSIHNASPRKNKPFVPLNCAAMPRELIASELFGYVEGAFTGARKNGAPGKVELADGGTLFLDEIGDMPLDLQVHLLKVIEDRGFTRLGDSKLRQADVRIIAATNQDLKKLVDEGKFRLDLFYRLNVFTLELPPLRERIDDIPALVYAFLKQCSEKVQSPVVSISETAMEALKSYSWEGNLRELRNVVEYGMNIAIGSEISVYDLPKYITEHTEILPKVEKKLELASLSMINDSVKMREEELIRNLMLKHNGNKSLVAKELGMSRPALYRRLSKIEDI